MAKRIVLIGLAALLLTAVFTAPAYCNDPLMKLGRGACNMLTFPLEMFKQVYDENRNSGPLAAVTLGILKGFGMSGVRLIVGAYEVATFPFPVPSQYMPILTDPEFFGDDLAW